MKKIYEWLKTKLNIRSVVRSKRAIIQEDFMICNKCFGSGIDIENDCYCNRCEGQGEILNNNRDHEDDYELVSDFDIDPDMGDH